MILYCHCTHLSDIWFSHYFSDIQSISDSLKCCCFFSPLFGFTPQNIDIFFFGFAFTWLAWSWENQPASHTVLKIVKCAWKNSDVSSSVQDFHRLHFEIVTSAAASTPKEVRAYPQRGSGPVIQAHLERGLRLDLVTHIEGIQPKGPYLPCVSMAGRALLAGCPRYIRQHTKQSWTQMMS